MGLCASKQDARAPSAPGAGAAKPGPGAARQGSKANRGRVRRLSLVTSESKQEETGVAVQEKPQQPTKPTKGRRVKRLSLISGELGGDAGFECDAQSITFYEGAQIEDDGRLTMAGQGQSELKDVEPPPWLTYGAFTRAGHDGVARKTNQDAYLVCPHFHGNKNQFLFGVFDGHGTEGHFVSRAITRLYPKHVASKLQAGDDSRLALDKHGPVLKHGFVQTEEDLFASSIDTTLSGSTAVSVLLRGKDMLLANTGDSRCVVGRREGSRVAAMALTTDHKPDDESEKARIERMNGMCKQMYDPEYDEFIGPVRVWSHHYECKSPGIAMSRSIGDMVATEVGVISEPDITPYTLHLERDVVMIIATDGVWEFISDQEAVDIVMQFPNKPRDAAIALVEESLRRWQNEEEVVDDITAIVAFFDGTAEKTAALAAAQQRAATSPSK